MTLQTNKHFKPVFDAPKMDLTIFYSNMTCDYRNIPLMMQSMNNAEEPNCVEYTRNDQGSVVLEHPFPLPWYKFDASFMKQKVSVVS